MKIKVQVVNAFSIDGTGGNPAGIVFNADELTGEQKQAVASKAGFPETAFVSASSVADYKLDFFTPVKQIPHCGHATIATFSYLKQNGKISKDHSSKETIDGTRVILFKGEMAFMEQRAPVFGVPKETDPILDAIGINHSDLILGQLPTIVNTGNSFLIIPVADETLLSRIKYNKAAVSHLSEKYGLIGFYFWQPDFFHTLMDWNDPKEGEFRASIFFFILINLVLCIFTFIKNFSLIPLIGLSSCLYLLTGMSHDNWFWFGLWFAIGLIIYFCYGYRNSKLRKA